MFSRDPIRNIPDINPGVIPVILLDIIAGDSLVFIPATTRLASPSSIDDHILFASPLWNGAWKWIRHQIPRQQCLWNVATEPMTLPVSSLNCEDANRTTGILSYRTEGRTTHCYIIFACQPTLSLQTLRRTTFSYTAKTHLSWWPKIW